MKKSKGLIVCLSFALLVLSLAAAQQRTDEKVVCPVSGESMLKSQAAATYEYEGKTYYFCCAGCKAKFVKDPAKYIAKASESKDAYTCPMHPDVKSDKPGKCPQCGMNLVKASGPAAHGQEGMEMKGMACCPMQDVMAMKDVSVVTENTKDGVVIRITAKDPETVKKIQEMGAKCKTMHEHK